MTLRTTKLMASTTFGKTCKLILGRTAAVQGLQHTGGCGRGAGVPPEGVLRLQPGAANLGKKSWGCAGVRKGTSRWVWSDRTWAHTAAQKGRALLPRGQHTYPSLGLVPRRQHSTQQAALQLSCRCFGKVQNLH